MSPPASADLREVIAGRPSNDPALITSGGMSWTYGELLDSVERAAAGLAALTNPGGRVAIHLRGGPEAVIATLAAACVGAAAPLNPRSPSPELGRHLQRLRPSVIITGAGASPPAAAVPAGTRSVEVELDGDGSLLVGGSRAPRRGSPPPRPATDLGAILPTGGTSGDLKLAALTLGNLAAAGSSMVRAFRLDPGSRAYCVPPVFTGHAVMGLVMATLHAGGALIIEADWTPGDLWRAVRLHGVNWWSAAPAVHRMIALDRPRGHEPLRFVRSAAAPLSPAEGAELEERLQAPVLQGYGATEAYNLAANPPPPGLRKPGSAGLPASAEIRIDGEEVIARGPTVAAAYVDDPAASAAAFAGGWYRTGDAGTFDSDGYLHLRGRITEMINRGGDKVWPAEVDACLREHPAVDDAMAFAIPDAIAGEDLGAAVVLRGRVSTQDLLAHVRERLAPHKVPSSITVLREMPPPLATGKRPRKAVADLVAAGQESGAGSRQESAAEAGVDAAVEASWRRILGVPALDRDAAWTELGGDSLTAVRLLLAVREATGVELPMGFFAQEPVTWGRMSAEVRRLAGAARQPANPGIIPVKASGGLPPLLLLNVVHATVPSMRPFGRAMAPDRPLIGLIHEFPGGRPDPSIRVRQLADVLMPLVREASGGGPYLLAGHSLAGLVALEIATRLRRRGAAVPLLVLIDTLAPDPRARRRRRWARPRHPAGWTREMVYWAELRASWNAHRPAPYAEPVLLLATRSSSEAAGPVLGWDAWDLPQLVVERTPGDHLSLLRPPHVERVAAQVAAAVDGPDASNKLPA